MTILLGTLLEQLLDCQASRSGEGMSIPSLLVQWLDQMPSVLMGIMM
jgi:hypothetical protein